MGPGEVDQVVLNVGEGVERLHAVFDASLQALSGRLQQVVAPVGQGRRLKVGAA
jgi:hypothetical protein